MNYDLLLVVDIVTLFCLIGLNVMYSGYYKHSLKCHYCKRYKKEYKRICYKLCLCLIILSGYRYFIIMVN